VKGFLFTLIPPRPDFAATMNEEEMAVMAAHVAYWTEATESGQAIAFGPVADDGGSYGIGVILAEDLADAERLRDADPAVVSERGFRTEIRPMLALVTAQGRYNA
jgi:uncharacterized protein YciI